LDLLHLIENTFDRKRIAANPIPYPKPNPNHKPNSKLLALKKNNVFGLTKRRHFSRKVQIPIYLFIVINVFENK